MILEELTLQGILSFAPDTPPIPLRPLNILIGPNGSGKSNLIDAIDLLRSTTKQNLAPIRSTTGGFEQWIWNGESDKDAATVFLRSRIVNEFNRQVTHSLTLGSSHFAFFVWGEEIYESNVHADPIRLFKLSPFGQKVEIHNGKELITVGADKFDTHASVLSQIRDPVSYPGLYKLTKDYEGFRIFREWSFGRKSVFRVPQPADMPSNRLEEDFSNLGLFLNRLRETPKAKRQLLERLQDLYPGIDDFDVRVQGGSVELYLTEGDWIIPAGRLSDGTLRYLCLLAILCDPNPPPLICLEEPELGLHPDILPNLADLMIEASERTQLIVTTHSDVIVDAMSDQPESVVVVEKHEGRTRMKRLENSGETKAYLEQYRLGEMWLRGMIGGTRW